MKKVFSLLMALTLVLSAGAIELQQRGLKADAALPTLRQNLFQQAPEMPALQNLRRAPQQTAAITDLQFEQNSLYTSTLRWKAEKGTSEYMVIGIYDASNTMVAMNMAIADSIIVEDFYYMSLLEMLNSNPQQGDAWSNYIKTFRLTYNSQTYNFNYLVPGTYSFRIAGMSASYELSEAVIAQNFTIVSYEVQNLTLTPSADHTQATIAWDEPANLPSDAVLYLEVYGTDTTYYTNFVSGVGISPITSPVTVGIEDNTLVSVYAVYYVANNYNLIHGYAVNESVTVGVNKYTPTNLTQTVLDGENKGRVLLAWEATEQAPYYMVTVYFEDGTPVTFSTGYPYVFTNTTTANLGLIAGTYTWEVTALDAQGNYLTEAVKGGEFTMPDAQAPVVASLTVAAVSETAATITFRSLDAVSGLNITAYIADTLGNKIADATPTDASTYTFTAEMTDLTAGTEYVICVIVTDEAGNTTPLASATRLTFYTRDAKTTPINLTATVLDGENLGKVVLAWEAEEMTEYYRVVLMRDGVVMTTNSGNQYVLFPSNVDTVALAYGTYTWSVQAMVPNDNGYVYAVSDFVEGPEFKMPDTTAPQMADAQVVAVTETSATITVRALDAVSGTDITIVVVDELDNVLATAVLTDDATYTFTATLEDLKAGTHYVVYLLATDEAGNTTSNENAVELSFTTEGNPTTDALRTVEAAQLEVKKVVENGVVYIIRDGKRFNLLGAEVK